MLNLTGLSKTFNKNTPYEKKLYNDLNLRVEEGDFITVIGSNGAGKSTLFKLISNSIKLDEGTINIKKADTTKNHEFQTAKRIATVVQDPKASTVGKMTVFENFQMAKMKGKRAGLKFCLTKKVEADFIDKLKQFQIGLEDKLHIRTELLSGGQRQVLSLLMATLNIPELLLLDEHTAALDPSTSEKVMAITKSVVTENKLTCMMITHKLEDAIKYGNRLIMIHEGKVLLDIKEEEKKKITVEKLLQEYNKMNTSLSDRQLFS